MLFDYILGSIATIVIMRPIHLAITKGIPPLLSLRNINLFGRNPVLVAIIRPLKLNRWKKRFVDRALTRLLDEVRHDCGIPDDLLADALKIGTLIALDELVGDAVERSIRYHSGRLP